MNHEKITLWLWLVCVAVVGGILGYIQKHERPATRMERFRALSIGVSSSMFAAYCTFQIAFYYLSNENVSVAIAGVAAWMGADAFLTLEKIVLNNLNNKKEG